MVIVATSYEKESVLLYCGSIIDFLRDLKVTGQMIYRVNIQWFV